MQDKRKAKSCPRGLNHLLRPPRVSFPPNWASLAGMRIRFRSNRVMISEPKTCKKHGSHRSMTKTKQIGHQDVGDLLRHTALFHGFPFPLIVSPANSLCDRFSLPTILPFPSCLRPLLAAAPFLSLGNRVLIDEPGFPRNSASLAASQPLVREKTIKQRVFSVSSPLPQLIHLVTVNDIC
jgi:hypothetical protein